MSHEVLICSVQGLETTEFNGLQACFQQQRIDMLTIFLNLIQGPLQATDLMLTFSDSSQ
jgi:hypothetical protein